MTDPGTATPGPDGLLAMMPYATTLGIQLHQATPELVTGSLAWTPELCTAGGILHGGAIMSLADAIGAVCAFLNLPQGAGTATIDSTTRLYRPLCTGTLHATASPAHIGRTLIAVTTDLTDDQDRLIAQTSQAQAIITAAHPAPATQTSD
jgi:1,4-dihydroxy-2-naphthoyl-CoA hydrolase